MDAVTLQSSHSETRCRLGMLSQFLRRDSSIVVESVLQKYPSLLEVPYISETDLLLTRRVGSGSFGDVYHGVLFSQDVAVKCLTVRNFTDELEFSEAEEADEQKAKHLAKTLLALEREVSIMKGLLFANIVQFYGVCLKPAAIVTQYCSRGSLFDLIGNARSSPRIAKELTWKRRLQLARDAAIGMDYLHSRMDPVLHRDLKSPNLLVDEYYSCKVADFNTSCFIDHTTVTNSILANNPRWMAPEVADGSPFSKASDVYPFGIILWELMTWREPFESDNETLRAIQILTLTVRDGYRPEIVPNDQLQGGPCPVYDDYLKLMKECWDQDPEKRPSFEMIVKRLQQLITAAVQTTETTNRSPASPLIHHKSQIPQASPPHETLACHERSRSTPLTQLSEVEDSPFKYGPPPSEIGEDSPELDKEHVEDPPSFPGRSHQVKDANVESPKRPNAVSRGKQWWKRLSSEHFQVCQTSASQKRRSDAMTHWDSLRTLLFGDRESDHFVQRFSNFVLGDETELTKQVDKATTTEQRSPVGLRVLKAMMELEPEHEEKERDRWSIVKHLMLENLKSSTRHPLWKALAKTLNNAQTKVETLSSIQEYKECISMEVKKPSRGRVLWKKVQVLFDLENYSPSKPLKSPYWSILSSLFFNDQEEEMIESHPVIPEVSPVAGTSQEVSAASLRAQSNWKKLKKLLDIDPRSSWDRNREFLTRFAQEQHPEVIPDSPHVFQNSKPRSRGWDRVRKLLIVDEKPPSEDKWKFVRDYLLENDFGHDWAKVSTFVKSHPQPPKEGHWDRFRRLFFENKKLREQSQWSFLKDLFLKQDDESFQVVSI